MSGQTSAPAKAILVGEHAVVYGMPAIAVPLSEVRAYADYEKSADALTVHVDDKAPPLLRWPFDRVAAEDPLAAMIRLIARFFGISELKGKIFLRSDIPIARGLGSGAAVSAVIGRAVAGLLNRDIEDYDLNDLVYEVEKIHHGTPSGVDNTVVVHEEPVYFVKGLTLDFMRVAKPLYLVVADTGIAALTRETVADVRDLYRRRPQETSALMEEIGALTGQARIHAESGQARHLGKLMTRNHELLHQLGVSSAPLDRLVNAAMAAGAYGAKLSGGGRGGNVIALASEQTEPKIKEAVLAAGAERVFSSIVGGRSASK